MVNITLPYLELNDHTAFLRLKQYIIENNVWKASFYVHVFTSCFCLLAGFTQFSNKIYQKTPAIHRIVGYLYITVVVFLSGPSGFVMALFANGGTTSKTAFLILSLLWIFFTLRAFIHAKNKKINLHREDMMRSYALTLSAITLRAWKYIIAYSLRPHPMDLYQVVAWLGWIPNLVFIEWYIRKHIRKQ